MIGQRVLPQRNRAPLQTTQRLFWRPRATIWFSSKAEFDFLIRLFTQLSEELALFCLYVRVMSSRLKRVELHMLIVSENRKKLATSEST
jgi:predicted secreted protein